MGRTKPLGVTVGIAGCAAFGWGLYNLLGIGSCGGEYPPCPADSWPYFLALPLGIITAILSVFAGGGAVVFMGIFATVGIASIVRALDGGVDGDTTFPWVFGGMFLASSLIPGGLIVFGRAASKRTQRLVASGARGTATVLAVSDTGVTINDNPRVRLRLRVEPHSVGSPFEIDKAMTVSRLAIPRPGDRYEVHYDETDTSRLVLSTEIERAAPVEPGPAAPAPSPAPAGGGDFVSQLAKLNELRLSGGLTDEEFQAAKDKLLGSAA